MKTARICLNVDLQGGVAGGVEQYVLGLSRGLLRVLDPGQEELVFFAADAAATWLERNVGPNLSIIRRPSSTKVVGVADRLKDLVRRGMPKVYDRIRRVPLPPRLVRPVIPVSDGVLEAAGVDLIHFPTQGAWRTDIASVYQPHDLQHVHLPELFSTRERVRRDWMYGAFCSQARMIAVVSSWAKRDLIRSMSLPPEKIAVIPYAPILSEYPVPHEEDIEACRCRLHLPERFLFYPAQTYRHKNHVGLLEALARLRDQGTTIPLVASGHKTDFFRVIARLIQRLKLESQVQFLGFVSPLELQCLYRLAHGLVVPTLFEAASFPVWEAFQAGTPVACSNVTSLPEQVGEAAILFEPHDPEAMAYAIERLWTDEGLRRKLVVRGQANVSQLSWERVARTFRAHYRRLLGRRLLEEDLDLLNAVPVM